MYVRNKVCSKRRGHQVDIIVCRDTCLLDLWRWSDFDDLIRLYVLHCFSYEFPIAMMHKFKSNRCWCVLMRSSYHWSSRLPPLRSINLVPQTQVIADGHILKSNALIPSAYLRKQPESNHMYEGAVWQIVKPKDLRIVADIPGTHLTPRTRYAQPNLVDQQ